MTIGVVHTKQGKWEQALPEFLAAAQTNPRNAEAFRWASMTYARLGDVVNEARTIRSAFEIAPDDPYYARWFHWVLVEKLGDYRQALTFYETALDAPGVAGNERQRARRGDIVDRRKNL